MSNEEVPGSGQRAVCVVTSPELRRTLRRSLLAAGTLVEFRDSIEDDASPASLLFLDQDARRSTSLPTIMQIIGENGRVVILGDTIADEDVVKLLRNSPLNHVIHDVNAPDETELVVTTAKLSSGDIFGLEKYLSWGVPIREISVSGYDDKRDAIGLVLGAARSVGGRRQVCARIENVTDELLMNAIYDAPTVDEHGLRGSKTSSGSKPALLRYGCDGRYFAVSVTDDYGALQKDVILDNLLRAREERGRPRSDGEGAGLGLYFVLSSVTRFIANVQPGRRSEIICLFDLRQAPRDASGCAESLHIFTTARG